jgi:hypothetical protein
MDMSDVKSQERSFIIHRAVQFLAMQGSGAILLISYGLLACVAIADFLTGVRLSVAPLYLVPIGIVSLRASRSAAITISIIAGMTWMFLDFLSPGELTWIEDVWNITMRSGVFILFALTLARIKADRLRETKLNSDLQAALLEVKQLSGLLPICAWCKRIRDDEGEWESIETYISDHSAADFTHGICPDCAQRVHPALQQHPHKH